MIIQCPQCQSTYEIANAAAVAGRKVRCTRCYHIWRAEVIEAAAAAPAAAELQAATAAAGNAGDAAEAAAHATASESGGANAKHEDAASGHHQADDDQAGYGDEASHDDDHHHHDPADDSRPGLAAAGGDDQFAAEAPAEDDELAGDAAESPMGDDRHDAGALQSADADEIAGTSYAAANGAANGSNARNGRSHGFGHDDHTAAGSEAASIAAAAPMGERLVRARRVAASDQEFWSDNEPVRREPQLSPARSSAGDRANGVRQSRLDGERVVAEPAETSEVALPRRRSWAARIGLTFGWLVLIGAVGGVVAAMALAPERVIETVPATANIYDRFGFGTAAASGLEFGAVTQSWTVDTKARPALEIKGEVRNASNDSLTVPTVVFALFDQEGLEIFNWATPIKSTKLASGKSTRFTVKIPAPPDAAKKLEVRFAKAAE